MTYHGLLIFQSGDTNTEDLVCNTVSYNLLDYRLLEHPSQSRKLWIISNSLRTLPVSFTTTVYDLANYESKAKPINSLLLLGPVHLS